MSYGYCFTEEEAEQAATEWGFNCGPTALAFAARVSLSAVRGMIPGFEQKRYTSPTMMKQGIANLGREFEPRLAGMSLDTTMLGRIAVVRVQWTGPWTQPGSNPRWAYNYTHWICSWLSTETALLSDKEVSEEVDIDPECDKAKDEEKGDWVIPQGTSMIFDVNGGIQTLARWQGEIVPLLTALHKRADGGWFPTHVWELQ